MSYSEHFKKFNRGVARRRWIFLKNGDQLIFPKRGEIWNPSVEDLAKCDAFIVFFVAELEFYFEEIIKDALEDYKNGLLCCFLKNCKTFDDVIKNIKEKKSDVDKNHNANWTKISHLFEFVGLTKDAHFPEYFWDEIQTITSHRGDLAHKSSTLQIVVDRRILMDLIVRTIKRVKDFDKEYCAWRSEIHLVMEFLSQKNSKFSPQFVEVE